MGFEDRPALVLVTLLGGGLVVGVAAGVPGWLEIFILIIFFSPEGVGTVSPLKEGCREEVFSFRIGLGFSEAGVAAVVGGGGIFWFVLSLSAGFPLVEAMARAGFPDGYTEGEYVVPVVMVMVPLIVNRQSWTGRIATCRRELVLEKIR